MPLNVSCVDADTFSLEARETPAGDLVVANPDKLTLARNHGKTSTSSAFVSQVDKTGSNSHRSAWWSPMKAVQVSLGEAGWPSLIFVAVIKH